MENQNEKVKKSFKNLGQIKKSLKDLFIVPNEVVGINKFYLLLSTFFGCGYFRFASGTFASIVAAIIGFVFISFSHIALFILIMILLVIGFISADKSIIETNNDPSFVVIDEVVGQLIPFLLIGSQSFLINLLMSILALVIFRILDIYKPWIIGKAETSFKGGIAIMMDDILAGVFTLFIIFIILLFV